VLPLRQGAQASSAPAVSPTARRGVDWSRITNAYIELRERYRTGALLVVVFLVGAVFTATRPLDTLPGVEQEIDWQAEHAEAAPFKEPSTTELARAYERFGKEVREEAMRQMTHIRAQWRQSDVQTAEPTGPIAAVTREGLPPTRIGRSAQVQQVYRIIQKYAPRHQHPRALAEAIVSESEAQNYDPLFVAAVIKSESAFNALAKSNKGAQGLMQLMPATGKWLAKEASIPRGSLTDTGHNLELGVRYLKQLEAQYNGDRVFTLIAYNWGPGRVESAADGKRRVPPEVVTYAIKILNDYRRWRRLS
jgi:soluble lytic murein transglycosylase-like protein